MLNDPKFNAWLKHWPTLLPAAALLLATLILYAPTFSAPAHWDDLRHLTENPLVRTWRGLYTYWLMPNEVPQYYPVVFTSYCIEYHLWGYTMWPYHVVNTLFHAANAILLMMVLRKIKVPLAFLIALIFACHPIHVESVVLISEAKNTMSFFFFLLATWAYLRYADTSATRRWLCYAGAIVLFTLAIQSKTVVFVFPLLMAMILIYQQGKITWRQITGLIPFVIIAIPHCLFVSHLEHTSVGTFGPEYNFTIVQKFVIAGQAFWFYLGKMLWPYPLMPVYPRWDIEHAAAWQLIFAAAALATFFLLIILRKRLGHTPWLLTLAYFFIMSPALGFITYYTMRFSFVSDHYVYMGSVPIIMGGILLARSLYQRASKHQQTLTICGFSVLAALCVLTYFQGMRWLSWRSIWEYNFNFNQRDSMVQGNLGASYLQEKQYDLATQFLLMAAKDPSHRDVQLYNLGTLKSQQNLYDEAIVYFQQAAELAPNSTNAWMQLGIHLQAVNRFAEAIRAYERTLAISPYYATAKARLAYCKWVEGDIVTSRKLAREAVDMDRSDTLAPKVLNLVETTPPPATSPAPATRPRLGIPWRPANQ